LALSSIQRANKLEDETKKDSDRKKIPPSPVRMNFIDEMPRQKQENIPVIITTLI
jgi:hypothetical protein